MESFPRRSQQLRDFTQTHARQILKLQPSSTPWAWMIISGLATLTPLIAGYFRQEISISIYGALTGYLIGLCDHRGTFRNRLLVSSLCTFSAWAAFTTGIYLHQSLWGFVAVTSMVVYLLGLLGGRGAEFERLLIFSAIMFFTARYAKTLTPAGGIAASSYFLIAYLVAVSGIVISRLTIQKKPSEYQTVFVSAKAWLSLNRSHFYYALTYTVSVIASIVFIEQFEVERGYWTVVTVLLMMKPDQQTSFYRIAQRMFGTLLGVFFGEIWILTQPPLPVLMFGAFMSSALVPFVWNRNYWLVTFCATNLVIFLLCIAQYGHVDPRLTLVRTEATLYGCLISTIVILIFKYGKIRRTFLRT